MKIYEVPITENGHWRPGGATASWMASGELHAVVDPGEPEWDSLAEYMAEYGLTVEADAAEIYGQRPGLSYVLVEDQDGERHCIAHG